MTKMWSDLLLCFFTCKEFGVCGQNIDLGTTAFYKTETPTMYATGGST